MKEPKYKLGHTVLTVYPCSTKVEVYTVYHYVTNSDVFDTAAD